MPTPRPLYQANYGQGAVLVMMGVAHHGDTVKLPDLFGRTDAHVFYLSVSTAGIPIDTGHYDDNGFSGFLASASELPDGSGWTIYATSADSVSGGMPAVAPRGIDVNYMVFRIIDFPKPPEPK